MLRWILLFVLTLPLAAKTAEWDVASKLFQEGNYRQAASVLKASKKDPDNLFLLGRTYIEMKQFSEAAEALENAAKLSPKDSVLHMWLGRAYGWLAESNKLLAFGRARKARSSFEKSVELDPKNLEALSDLFEFYIEAPGIVGGGVDKAEKVAQQVTAIDPAKGKRLLDRVASERHK